MSAGGGDQKSGKALMPDPIEATGQARDKAADCRRHQPSTASIRRSSFDAPWLRCPLLGLDGVLYCRVRIWVLSKPSDGARPGNAQSVS